MGETTNAFETTLGKAVEQCRKLIQDRRRADTKIEEIRDPLLAVSNALQKRVAFFGGDIPDNDELGVKLSRQFDDMADEFAVAQTAQQIAVDKLRKASTKLREDVTKFEKYVASKEKSKNPFKGKKSVPNAKALINQANDFLDSLGDLLEV